MEGAVRRGDQRFTGTNPYDPDIFIPDVQALAADYDIVIPYFHFELIASRHLRPGLLLKAPAAPSMPVRRCRQSHPRGAWSFTTVRPSSAQSGNFIFDQMFSGATREEV